MLHGGDCVFIRKKIIMGSRLYYCAGMCGREALRISILFPCDETLKATSLYPPLPPCGMYGEAGAGGG